MAIKYASPFVFLLSEDSGENDVPASGTFGWGEDDANTMSAPTSLTDYALNVGIDMVGAPGTEFADKPDGVVDVNDYSAFMDENFPGYPLVID